MIKQKYQALMAVWNHQNPLYKPSIFWAEASMELVEDFEAQGIENFRSLESSLLFFVPTYGYPGNGLSPDLVKQLHQTLAVEGNAKQYIFFEQVFSGYTSALADYRVLKASNPSNSFPHFTEFSESLVGNPIEHFEFDGRFYSRSALNYLLGLSFLKQFTDFSDIKTVLEIGGGFGTLGEIVLKTLPDVQYIDVDIPPTSFASEYYLQQVFGTENISTFDTTQQMTILPIESLKPASVLNAWQIEQLMGTVDLFVNFISFQEMEPDIVQNYLQQVKRLNPKWILLRNMREGKQLRKNHRFGVETPILSESYIEMLGGYELVGRNVMPFGYKTIDNFHSEILLFKRHNS